MSEPVSEVRSGSELRSIGSARLRVIVYALAASGAVFLLIGILKIGWIVWLFWPDSAASYADQLITEPGHYEVAEPVLTKDLIMRLYAYERSPRLSVLRDGSGPKLADAEGRLPVFRHDGDVYVIFTKWVNQSSGLVISDKPDFVARFHEIDRYVTAEPVRDSVYEWRFHAEVPRPSTQ